jgi:hypothetical protein
VAVRAVDRGTSKGGGPKHWGQITLGGGGGAKGPDGGARRMHYASSSH